MGVNIMDYYLIAAQVLLSVQASIHISTSWPSKVVGVVCSDRLENDQNRILSRIPIGRFKVSRSHNRTHPVAGKAVSTTLLDPKYS